MHKIYLLHLIGLEKVLHDQWHQSYQKQGIGKMLVDVAVRRAKEHGLKKLHLFAFDPAIPEYYERLGWKKIGMDEFRSHPVIVMEVVL